VTPEEAGEEILTGRPYETCSMCRGSGKRQLMAKGGKIVDINCSVCFTKGNVIRPLWHVAAKTLGIAIPPQPRGAIPNTTTVEFDWRSIF
jgi:hypothetical protein